MDAKGSKGVPRGEHVESDQATDTLDRHSDISRDIGTLKSITRIVQTNANTLDLYAGDQLVMILDQQNGQWMVRDSSMDFRADSIDYAFSQDEKAAVSSPLTFTTANSTPAAITQSGPIQATISSPERRTMKVS